MNGHPELETGVYFLVVLLTAIFVLLLVMQGTLMLIWRQEREINICIHHHDEVTEGDEEEEDWGMGEPNRPSED